MLTDRWVETALATILGIIQSLVMSHRFIRSRFVFLSHRVIPGRSFMLSLRSHLVTLLFLSLSILQQTSQNKFKSLVVNDVYSGSHLLSASVFYLKVID